MVAVFYTPLGNIKITAEQNRIETVEFSNEPLTPDESCSPVIQVAKQELEAYFAKKRTKLEFPIHMKGTDFQKKVWQELLNIPFGKTISYHDLSVALGDPKSIRAAASANGKNPLAIVVPCHRVIGSNGDLVGYAGGLDKKKWLLQHEGVINQLDIFEP